jgi:hypothetical protein
MRYLKEHLMVIERAPQTLRVVDGTANRATTEAMNHHKLLLGFNDSIPDRTSIMQENYHMRSVDLLPIATNANNIDRVGLLDCSGSIGHMNIKAQASVRQRLQTFEVFRLSIKSSHESVEC